jgi:hypothetical protein
MPIKIFNILSLKGNANQKVIEVLSHPSQNGNQQENKYSVPGFGTKKKKKENK